MEASYILWVIFLFLIAYIIVIGIITIGWIRIPQTSTKKITVKTKVSVIIAVRNEAGNIYHLLESLVKQTYDPNLFDIVIVDDHSEDETVNIINKYIHNDIISITLIKADKKGKKSALLQGINYSNSELIITTDGDCSVNSNWISAFVDYYVSSNKKVISGPVTYSSSGGFWEGFFRLDFSSLVAAGAGSIGVGLPLMGNGANMAFSKEIYTDFDNRNDKHASGDDVFLMHHVTKKFGAKSLGFLKNEDSMVITHAPNNISSFMSQRMRWGSKAKGYRLIWPIVVSLVVFLFNAGLSAILISGFFMSWAFIVYALLVITKYFIDFPLVYRYLNFSNAPRLKPLFFFAEFIYPLYIFTASILALFFKFSWKNRDGLS